MTRKIFLHAMPVRIWHWTNAVSFIVLIVTGLQIRYREAMHLMSFEGAVDIHNIFGFILIFNFFIWLVYYLVTGKIKIYIPPLNPKKFVLASIKQARYYGFGIFMGEENPHHPSPEHKFNSMQQAAYLMIMVCLIPLQMISGLLLWDIKKFAPWIALFGGVAIVDAMHVLLFFFFTSFLFVHVYLATLGHTPLAHIKAMFTGYEETEEHAH